MKGYYEVLLIHTLLYLPSEFSVAYAFNHQMRESHVAHKAFFHSGVQSDICKMKQFNVEKLLVTQACLHVSYYM